MTENTMLEALRKRLLSLPLLRNIFPLKADRRVRALILTAVFLLSCVSLSASVYELAPKARVAEEVYYTTTERVGASYMVRLKSNEYFEDDKLDMDGYYIRKFTDAISLELSYSFEDSSESAEPVSGSELAGGVSPSDASGSDLTASARSLSDLSASALSLSDLTPTATAATAATAAVSYCVIGRLDAAYKDGEQRFPIWSKRESLLPSETDTFIPSEGCKLSIPIEFDFASYAELIDGLREKLSLSIYAAYSIDLIVSTTVSIDGRPVTTMSNCSVVIPLSDSVYSISIPDSVPTDTPYTRTVVTYERSSTLFALFLLLSVLLALIGVCCICVIDVKTIDAYRSELMRIKALIGDRIVYVEHAHEPAADDIEVSDFASILRLADERALPILCYSEREVRRVQFFLTESGQSFVFILSGEGTD